MSKMMSRAIAALTLTAAVGSAYAVEVDLTGYFRAGAGTSTEGGEQVCFRLPGSIVWFRLGNECDLYSAIDFGLNLGEVDGTKFKAVFTMAYGTQQLANWEQSAPSWRQLYVEATDIGTGIGVPALKGASLWAGKRFYKNVDIHMVDYTYWEIAQGPGFGLSDIDIGKGKFSYAMSRVGDATGYGINPSLTGYSPDLIGGGSRSSTVHDFRVHDIATNPDGKFMFGIDLVRKNNRSGTSTYTTQTTTPVLGVDGKVYDAIVLQPHTIDNQQGRNGFGMTANHRQSNLFGLGGFNDVVLQYASNAASLKGFGFGGTSDKRREWLMFDQWVIEPKDMPISANLTMGVRHSTINDQRVREFWVGARPQYHINNIWSLMSEVGYQSVSVEDQDTRKLAKITLGTQFSMGRSIWSRPSIRFFATHARWNSAAAAAGPVACSGRDCVSAVPTFADKRQGTSYGVQVEGWY